MSPSHSLCVRIPHCPRVVRKMGMPFLNFIFSSLHPFQRELGGQTSYYNAPTQEFVCSPDHPRVLSCLMYNQNRQEGRRKPLLNTRIPRSGLASCETTEGNIFYSHKIKKESWRQAEEIQDAVGNWNIRRIKRKGTSQTNTISRRKRPKAEIEMSLKVHSQSEDKRGVKREAETIVYVR